MIIKVASRLGEVKEYYFSRKLKEIAAMKAQGIEVLNLGIGSPDLSPSAEVVETLREECLKTGSHQYQSYIGLPELRQAYADFYQKWYQVTLNPDQEILPLMGSKEGIMHISMSFLEQGNQVLIPNPGYPTYAAVTKLTGAEPITYDLSAKTNWLPNLDALAQRDLSKVKIMWVNYPHMPTGAKATKNFFEELIAFAKKYKILICNDNPYSFILNKDYLSLLSIDGAKEVAIELSSLSKGMNMAGWRMGVLLGQSDYVQTVLRFKSNMDSGMFKPMQIAAAKALALDENWYTSLNEVYKKRQSKVFELYDALGCSYDKNTSGMFVWGKVSTHQTGFDLSDWLLQETGIFITPGGIFGSQGNSYIRASLCNTVETFEQAITKIGSLVTT